MRTRGTLGLDEFRGVAALLCEQQEPRVRLPGLFLAPPGQGPTQWPDRLRDLRPGRVRLEGNERLLPPERCGPGGDQPERVCLARLQAGGGDLQQVERAE